MNFIYTNARSLLPKIHSLYDYFEELELSFACITETWMREGKKLEKSLEEMRHGFGLDIIYKNRTNSDGGPTTGGG